MGKREAVAWRLSVVILAMVVGWLAMSGTSSSADPSEHRASAFVLVDDAGRVRARLGMTQFGAEFALNNEAEQQRLTLLVGEPDGSSIVALYDSGGRPRIGVSVTRGTPSVQIVGANGDLRAAVGDAVFWKASK